MTQKILTAWKKLMPRKSASWLSTKPGCIYIFYFKGGLDNFKKGEIAYIGKSSRYGRQAPPDPPLERWNAHKNGSKRKDGTYKTAPKAWWKLVDHSKRYHLWIKPFPFFGDRDIAYLGSEKLALLIERWMIRWYTPPYNTQHNWQKRLENWFKDVFNFTFTGIWMVLVASLFGIFLALYLMGSVI